MILTGVSADYRICKLLDERDLTNQLARGMNIFTSKSNNIIVLLTAEGIWKTEQEELLMNTFEKKAKEEVMETSKEDNCAESLVLNNSKDTLIKNENKGKARRIYNSNYDNSYVLVIFMNDKNQIPLYIPLVSEIPDFEIDEENKDEETQHNINDPLEANLILGTEQIEKEIKKAEEELKKIEELCNQSEQRAKAVLKPTKDLSKKSKRHRKKTNNTKETDAESIKIKEGVKQAEEEARNTGVAEWDRAEYKLLDIATKKMEEVKYLRDIMKTEVKFKKAQLNIKLAEIQVNKASNNDVETKAEQLQADEYENAKKKMQRAKKAFSIARREMETAKKVFKEYKEKIIAEATKRIKDLEAETDKQAIREKACARKQALVITYLELEKHWSLTQNYGKILEHEQRLAKYIDEQLKNAKKVEFIMKSDNEAEIERDFNYLKVAYQTEEGMGQQAFEEYCKLRESNEKSNYAARQL